MFILVNNFSYRLQQSWINSKAQSVKGIRTMFARLKVTGFAATGLCLDSERLFANFLTKFLRSFWDHFTFILLVTTKICVSSSKFCFPRPKKDLKMIVICFVIVYLVCLHFQFAIFSNLRFFSFLFFWSCKLLENRSPWTYTIKLSMLPLIL